LEIGYWKFYFMIIGIDARVLSEGSGGIFGYAKNLLEHLLPLAKRRQIKLFVNRCHYSPQAKTVIANLAKNENVKLYRYRFPNKFLNASLRFRAWPKIDKLLGGCDVLFFPTMLYSAWSDETKAVLTMHDLSFEFYPEFFTLRQRLWHRLVEPRQLCQKADRIIAVSESTRADLLERYQLAPKKVRTVYSGINPTFRPIVDRHVLDAIRNKYYLPDVKYILQVGTLEPRKNAMGTLAAWEAWQLQNAAEAKDYHLFFVGHCGWKARDFFHRIKGSNFKDKIHVRCDVNHSDLPGLYNLASIFVYPSFYEGFGFPVLEAASCGVPIITSANSSLGEMIGNAALLVDPYRIDDIVEAMHCLASNANLTKILRAEGLARTVDFDWERTARETLNALESI